MTSTADAMNKKRRIQNACDECTRRKIRCDSATMPDNLCSSCLSLDVECTHDRVRKKRGPKPGSTRGNLSLSLKEMIDEILKETPSESCVVLADNMTTTAIVVKLAKRIRHLESELKFCRENHNKVLSDDHSPPVQAESELSSVKDVNQLTQDIARSTLGLSDEPIHFGESSNMMLVVTAMDHRKEADSSLPEWQSLLQNIKRQEYWDTPQWRPIPQPEVYNFQFPDEDELRRLTGAYFDRHALFPPLLYRPSFEKSLSDNLHLQDNMFGGLVLAVCAVGSRYYYSRRVIDRSDKNYVECGLKWFDQLPIKQYSFGQDVSLYQMQTYCLAMTYLQLLAAGNEIGWMMNGLAIRLAQEIGAHRHLVMDKRPTIEREIWKRLFWTLILFDLKYSVLFGRPRAISNQDFDLSLPIECDEEYWENDDPSRDFVQLSGKPSFVAGSNHFFKLFEIMAFSQQALYSVRTSDFHRRMGISSQDWQKRALEELDLSLNKWADSVPSHLKWNIEHQDEKFFVQSAILHSMYYWVQIQIHRRFIPRPGQDSQSAFPSLAICTNAARSCIHVAETYFSQKIQDVGHFLLPLFGAAMVLTVNLWRGKHTSTNFSAETELIDIYKCINMLRLFEPMYTLAGRLVDIINTVLSVNRGPAYPSGLLGNTGAQGIGGITPAVYQISAQLDPQSPLSSRDFSIDQRDLNLPFRSSELGQHPIHGPLNLYGVTSGQPSDPGFDHVVTDEELAIFEDRASPSSFQLQDWDVFMANVEEMFAAVESV
ncbi:hypothetical protein K435DRAFT_732999 [Dendrothele bispora CBS 962.96]|uniref:Zn(2)-C6 fungal-type domain-containing protein n=1 Tax=Dendrothele bispora (strain CBS 962.96) TaxID=1314807 RepID=A0A4S8L7L1_DENBC|nr:hypothetical protein K435DRAFT_732999 [Dendrothele bispora CBS 962.96]